MFGMNEKVGVFENSPKGDLLVTSMFMTLQGEGPFSGRPAFFVRLAKCNLACSFCDTYFDKGDWFTYTNLRVAIHDKIREYYRSPMPQWACADHDLRRMVLVITGGEPMLQPKLASFLEIMHEEFMDVQIESNGIVVQDIPRQTYLVVSPKCNEKDGKATKYLQPNTRMLARADCLKFVMSADQDSPYSAIPEWAHEWCKGHRPVYVSPMNVYRQEPKKAREMRAALGEAGTLEERSTVDEVVSFWEDGLLDMAANQRNHEYAARYCIKHGFRFGVQLHLLASVA